MSTHDSRHRRSLPKWYDWYRWPLIHPVWGLYWEMRGYYDTGRRYCGQPRVAALKDTLLNGWRRPR